jgi:solute carrier family 39 (zinc transporter), member 1/2/3
LETNIDSSDEDNQSSRVSSQSMIAFGLAITLHSFIDGLAIGVFKELSAITVLAISVVIHKVPVACSVGQSFLAHNKSWNDPISLVTFICFILASPIGMIVGMIIGEQEENMTLITIQALSGGTFVYLACCDLLIHEFH